MLHAIVRIEKPRPNGGHLRPLTVLQHRLDPFAGEDLSVIVEEKHMLASRFTDCEIHHGREVEGAWERETPVA